MPVVTWPLLMSLCWGVLGFAAAARNQKETALKMQLGEIGWTEVDDVEANEIADATIEDVLPPKPDLKVFSPPPPPPKPKKLSVKVRSKVPFVVRICIKHPVVQKCWDSGSCALLFD